MTRPPPSMPRTDALCPYPTLVRSLRPGARLDLRRAERGFGADHRLPLRTGPGDADVDHGCHGQGGTGGRAVPRFRSHRAYAPHRHPSSEEHTSELQSLMRISYAVFCSKNQHTTLLTNTEQDK